MNLLVGQVEELFGIGHLQGQRDIAYRFEQLVGEGPHVVAIQGDLAQGRQGCTRILSQSALEDSVQDGAVDEAEDLGNFLLANGLAGEGQDLVEQGLRIAHGAATFAGDDLEAGVGDADAFLLSYELESLVDGSHRNHLEIEALTAADYGVEQLLGVGGREDEDYVSRWLFEGLEQSVEALLGDHVHFVDDVDLVARPLRRVLHLLDQVADVVDAVVGSSINLDQVGEVSGQHLATGGALVAGVFGGALLAVEGSCEDAGGRGLAYSTRSGQ